MKRLLVLVALLFSVNTYAVPLTYFYGKNGTAITPNKQTAEAACQAIVAMYPIAVGWTYLSTGSGVNGGFCFQRKGTSQDAGGEWVKVTVDCPAGIAQDGVSCTNPNTNPCEGKAGQNTGWKATYPSFDAYNANKPRCTASQGGCAVDICGAVGSLHCAQSGQTGEYACFGNGTYSGQPQAASGGNDVAGCSPNCAPPAPTTSSNNQNCTAPAVANGVTTYTCSSSSNSNQWSSSNCAVGQVNGVTGLHCVKPGYVPQYQGKNRDDSVTQTPNANGGTTTTTNTTNTTTNCKAGACTTTSNNSTNTTVTNGNGQVTGGSSSCTGVGCGDDGKPLTPGEEGEEEGTAQMPGGIDGPDISGELPEIGDGEEPDFNESTGDYYDRISNAPIVRAFTSVAVPSGGSCNIGSAQLFGGNVSFDAFCDNAPQVLSGLRYLFLAIWAWAAIRLFGTA